MTDTFDIANKIQQIETHLQILYGDTASYLKAIESMFIVLSKHLKLFTSNSYQTRIHKPRIRITFTN